MRTRTVITGGGIVPHIHRALMEKKDREERQSQSVSASQTPKISASQEQKFSVSQGQQQQKSQTPKVVSSHGQRFGLSQDDQQLAKNKKSPAGGPQMPRM